MFEFDEILEEFNRRLEDSKTNYRLFIDFTLSVTGVSGNNNNFIIGEPVMKEKEPKLTKRIRINNKTPKGKKGLF